MRPSSASSFDEEAALVALEELALAALEELELSAALATLVELALEALEPAVLESAFPLHPTRINPIAKQTIGSIPAFSFIEPPIRNCQFSHSEAVPIIRALNRLRSDPGVRQFPSETVPLEKCFILGA